MYSLMDRSEFEYEEDFQQPLEPFFIRKIVPIYTWVEMYLGFIMLSHVQNASLRVMVTSALETDFWYT